MSFPDFFASAPVIRTVDPLAEFLGAAEGGRIDYRYEDAVRLAGHSCPTVASAFLMTRAALAALYGIDLPRRGEIRVDLAEAQDAGVAGVIASIATLITGATATTGFKGLAGRFDRRHKLFFGEPLQHGTLRFTRLDTGAGVEVAADLSRVPGDSRLEALMPKCLAGQATADEQAQFRTLWQERVRRLLLEHADDPEVIRLHR
ncbi:MAG: FmdE family protein [Rhodocyclaceae bacterium]